MSFDYTSIMTFVQWNRLWNEHDEEIGTYNPMDFK